MKSVFAESLQESKYPMNWSDPSRYFIVDIVEHSSSPLHYWPSTEF